MTASDARPGEAKVVLTGATGLEAAAGLHREVLPLVAAGGDVAVCCAAVDALHAAALQVLVCAAREAAARGQRFEVVGANRDVARVLERAGLTVARAR